MAAVIGKPGESARWVAYMDLLGLPFIVFIMVGLVIPVIALFADSLGGNRYVIVVGGVVVGALFGFKGNMEMYHAMRDSKNWARGASGEEQVGAVLATLSDDYVVFNDYHPTGADGKALPWNVDHIVVGPTGVFVIETKNYHIRKVRPAAKDTYTRKNVKQTQRNAMEFKNAFKTWSGHQLDDLFVKPLLVYTQEGAFVEKPFENPVKVIPLKWLAGEFTHARKAVLDPDQVYRISRAMFMKLSVHDRMHYTSELDRYGAISKRFKQQRVSERMAAPVPTPPLPADEPPALPRANESAVPTVCPLCGAPLVKRKARRGDRAGKSFLGCSAYGKTKCKFGFNLEE